jgi:hypothetical protein
METNVHRGPIKTGTLKDHSGKDVEAWDSAREQLDQYFDRNLSQIRSIFNFSVIVMTAGFAVMLWGLWRGLMGTAPTATALLATGAGVITQFIGGTFLYIFRSAIQQATTYASTLERMNSLGVAVHILETIPDGAGEVDLKNRTRAAVVEALVARTTDDVVKE